MPVPPVKLMVSPPPLTAVCAPFRSMVASEPSAKSQTAAGAGKVRLVAGSPGQDDALAAACDRGVRVGQEHRAARTGDAVRDASGVEQAHRVAGAAGEHDGVAAAADAGLRAVQADRAGGGARVHHEVPDAGRAGKRGGVDGAGGEHDHVVAAAADVGLRAGEENQAVGAGYGVGNAGRVVEARHVVWRCR